jgi:hypothetical protein
MKTFNEWLENRDLISPLIKFTFNSRRMLLNFSAQILDSSTPKDNQRFEPQIVITDKEFINYLLDQLSEEERVEVLNGIPVTLRGDKAEKIIRDNISRSELGWDHVARYYSLK